MAITINGTGTIAGISAGGLPDNCVDAGTIGALPGGLWKGDGTGQTIATGTDTKLDFFSTAKWTNGSMSWDDTNKRIAFPVAGVYACHVKISHGAEGYFDNDMHLIFKINGSNAHDSNAQMGFGIAPYKNNSEWYKSCVYSQFVEVAASDYLEVWFKQTTGGDVSLSGDYTYLNVQYMGGA
tara:strand:- start:78 stop:620 length:543 start_codon:yes stop_codon:yes gene_type:complete